MIDFIDDYREVYGVEPICRVVPIAPSTYRAYKAQQANANRQSARARRDAALHAAIAQTWDGNYQVYGVRKIWRALPRDGWAVARCTVERLMTQMGLQGVVRGRAPQTTSSDSRQAAPEDHVRRDFTADAPNRLWVADFTYVATWRGFVYIAFVVDVFARRIVGWRASSAPKTSLVLDALKQAIHDRQPAKT